MICHYKLADSQVFVRKVMILTLLLDANLSGMWNPSDVTETSHICKVMLNEARSISKGWS